MIRPKVAEPREGAHGHWQLSQGSCGACWGMHHIWMSPWTARALPEAAVRTGILYAKYKSEKLMEHLKLFATRLNIPRLIRVCEDLHHWRELVYLYIQYDEYDNAALVQVCCCSCAP